METDLFENLPREIMVEILRRVGDSRSIIQCKVVQKAWRDVVESQEFAYRCLIEGDSCRHLMLFIDRCRYGIMELDDENSHPDYYYVKGAEVVNSELRDAKSYAEPLLRSSVDGLVLLMRHDGRFKYILICNPMTDEYVTLPSPPNYCIFIEEIGYYFGFGKSMRSKQYKVVGITNYMIPVASNNQGNEFFYENNYSCNHVAG